MLAKIDCWWQSWHLSLRCSLCWNRVHAVPMTWQPIQKSLLCCVYAQAVLPNHTAPEATASTIATNAIFHPRDRWPNQCAISSMLNHAHISRPRNVSTPIAMTAICSHAGAFRTERTKVPTPPGSGVRTTAPVSAGTVRTSCGEGMVRPVRIIGVLRERGLRAVAPSPRTLTSSLFQLRVLSRGLGMVRKDVVQIERRWHRQVVVLLHLLDARGEQLLDEEGVVGDRTSRAGECDVELGTLGRRVLPVARLDLGGRYLGEHRVDLRHQQVDAVFRRLQRTARDGLAAVAAAGHAPFACPLRLGAIRLARRLAAGIDAGCCLEPVARHLEAEAARGGIVHRPARHVASGTQFGIRLAAVRCDDRVTRRRRHERREPAGVPEQRLTFRRVRAVAGVVRLIGNGAPLVALHAQILLDVWRGDGEPELLVDAAAAVRVVAHRARDRLPGRGALLQVVRVDAKSVERALAG